MFINKNFILASSSKSRYKILKKNNLNFIKIKPRCDEELIKKKLKQKKLKPIMFVKTLAKEKAKSISFLKPKDIVVGADTIIIFKDKIINKAKDPKKALKTIKKLSNKEHHIVSAASVFINNKQIWCQAQKTKIKIRKLSNKDINKYLKMCGKKILSTAGCYQIEILGPHIIENIKGDFFNVMGFPLFPFLNFLNKLNVKK